MKKIISYSVLFSLPFIGRAQEQSEANSFYAASYNNRSSGSFGKGAHLLTFCYGVPSTLHAEINGEVDPNRTVLGPVKLLYEFAIKDEVGIAIKSLYARGSWNTTDYWFGYTAMRTWAFAVGATGYYHFNKLIPVEQLDLFAGIGFYAGVQEFIWDVAYPNDTDTEFVGTPTISTGARYYFTKGVAVYTELGITGGSYINMGITFRFH